MKGQPLNIPTLTSKRLILEPISLLHSKGMFDLWSSANVCKYSGEVKDSKGNIIEMPAKSSADSDLIIEFWLQAAKDNWGFRWAILDLESRKFMGTIGFNSLTDCSEIAYHLIPKHWGKGIMTEASITAIAWSKTNGAHAIEAFVDPDNLKSILLLLRLGMTAGSDFSDGAQRYYMNI